MIRIPLKKEGIDLSYAAAVKLGIVKVEHKKFMSKL